MAAGAELWHKQTGKELADALVGVCDRLEQLYAARRNRARRNVRVYEGRNIPDLNASAYFTYVNADTGTDQYDETRLNLSRSLVHTAQAKIAGKQRPKAQFVVNDGDWKTKRKARKLERFVEAVMMQRQAGLQDAWSLGETAARDCMVVDSGALKFWADTAAKKVAIERTLTWQLLVDPADAEHGDPQNLFHVYPYDVENLVARFPDYEQAIRSAPKMKDESRSGAQGLGADVAHRIKVREGWRLPFSSDKPGKHAIAIPGVTLCEEEWHRPFFPFEIIVWEPWMIGIFGTSLVDNALPIHDELNAAAQRWAAAERTCSNIYIVAEEGSESAEELESNEQGVVIKYRQGGVAPQVVAPPTIGAGSQAWIQFLKSCGYEFPGISQMAATGQTDEGVTAAIAMRTQENIATERFSIPWQRYERVMAVGAARQIVACIRELAEEDPEFAVKWPGSGFLKEIKWADVNLDEDQYQIQTYAVSGLVNTPTDRLQLASELFDRKVISQDTFLRVIQAKDIDGELKRASTQAELIERHIEDWLDATPEDEESGKFQFRPPIKWMNHVEAIIQVGRAYMQAELDGCPEYNLKFFVKFLGLCDKEIEKQQQFQATIQAAAKGNSAAVQQMGPGAQGAAVGAPEGQLGAAA